ncbi:MAG: hypothetical protein M1823_008361, partial [Watsoniomyces obsoletus]
TSLAPGEYKANCNYWGWKDEPDFLQLRHELQGSLEDSHIPQAMHLDISGGRRDFHRFPYEESLDMVQKSRPAEQAFEGRVPAIALLLSDCARDRLKQKRQC